MQILVWFLILIMLIGIITLFCIFNVNLWFYALVSGVHIPIKQINQISVKKVNKKFIIDNYINAKKSGINLTIKQIENHILANGDIKCVIDSMKIAIKSGLKIKVETAFAIDLSENNLSEVVYKCITPKTLKIEKIRAFTREGTEVSISLKITHKVNFEKVIGGALEDTLVARFHKAVTTIIMNSNKPNDLLNNTEQICNVLMLNKGLSIDTVYDVLTVIITEIKIINIEADKIINYDNSKNFISTLENETDDKPILTKYEDIREELQNNNNKNLGLKKYVKLNNIKDEHLTDNAKAIKSNIDNLTPYLNTPKKKTKLQ